MNIHIKQVKIRAAGKMIAELKQGGYVDEKCSAAVFCTDRPLKAPEIKRLPHCCVQFLDTEDVSLPEAFTREQAAHIRDFLAGLPAYITMLYCCCDWGQSRSAGLAAACMTALGQDCEAVFRNRSYSPNLLVYATMCEALGCPRPSAERLRELDRLRSAAGEDVAQGMQGVKRILVTEDADVFSGGGLALPAELLGVPIELRGTGEAGIPCRGEELFADMKSMGQVFPGDMILVIRGIRDLRAGLAPEEAAAKMRTYLLWLKYIYQGAGILLVSPPSSLSDGELSREQLSKLAACYRRLAEDMRIPFADASAWKKGFIERQPKGGA